MLEQRKKDFTMKLSILDQIPVPNGLTPQQALHNSVALAKMADDIGYERFWLAEHHSTRTLASSAPEITASFIAAQTNRIHVGTGGIMMMHYSALKIAEQFNTLSALAPGRIDLGLGRAPGGDYAATFALAQGKRPYVDEQYQKLEAIQHLMAGEKSEDQAYSQVIATPFKVAPASMWLLGSTGQSAAKAADYGVGYSFAQFFSGQATQEIFQIYRDRFIPTMFMEKPQIIVSYAATVAPTEEEAEFRALPIDISRLWLMRGEMQPALTSEQAQEYPLSEMDKMQIEHNRKLHLVGTKEQVAEKLLQDQETYGFDEVMINSNQSSFEHRLESYQLLAQQLLTSK